MLVITARECTSPGIKSSDRPTQATGHMKGIYTEDNLVMFMHKVVTLVSCSLVGDKHTALYLVKLMMLGDLTAS